ncbi:MAG: aminodeoxychorismate/anthranilate synthase component II [Hadesarchaea archaeon]|nr:aminodeoxychorismate/anthranilate synthase component II [Hadesarchaea archaeon]
MRVAVIDNIDSFVYNLVQYLGELGAEPIVFRNDSELEKIRKIEPERIVISPGPKRPKDSKVSISVVKELGEEIPILGVCLGHQIIAYAFGGEVSQAKRIMHGKTSEIKHNGNTLFSGLPNPFKATRYHSLSVKHSGLPEEFEVIAETNDEDQEIMGLKHKNLPIWGTQFHPESILTTNGKQLIKNFLEADA